MILASVDRDLASRWVGSTERAAAAAAAFRICQKEAIGGGVDSEAAATDARYHSSGVQLIIWQPWPILE